VAERKIDMDKDICCQISGETTYRMFKKLQRFALMEKAITPSYMNYFSHYHNKLALILKSSAISN